MESPSGFRPNDAPGNDAGRDYVEMRRHGHSVLGRVVMYGRVCFVKSLAEGCRASGDAVGRLRKEYEILVGLNHPGIVRPMAFKDIEGVGPSIVMEYVRGVHLDEYLRNATRRQRGAVAQRLVEAVAYLHSNGITHLDLKPENIMVEGAADSPRVCIIDFNLSDGESFAYDKGAGGNLRYAAPEQFNSGYKAMPRADVWSLGLLLREMAPGRKWRSAIRAATQTDPSLRPADASVMLALSRGYGKAVRLWGILAGVIVVLGAVGLMLSYLLAEDNETPLLPNVMPDEAVSTVATPEMQPDETPAQPAAAAVSAELSPKLGEKGMSPSAQIDVASEPNVAPADFSEYELRYKNLMREVETMLEKGAKDLWTVTNDTLSSAAAERKATVGLTMANISTDAQKRLRNFRADCPAQLLATKNMEWATMADPAIKPAFGRFFGEINKMKEKMDAEIQRHP